MSYLKDLLGSTLVGMPARIPLDIADPSWLSRFRLGNAERAHGTALASVADFENAIEAGSPALDVQAAFLTACVTLHNNLRKLRQAKLIDKLAADMAEKAIRMLQGESVEALTRLEDGVAKAAGLGAYGVFAENSKGRLEFLSRYLHQVTEKGITARPYQQPDSIPAM